MNSPTMRWLLDLDQIPAETGGEGLRLAFERPLEPWMWALLLLATAAYGAWSYSRLTGSWSGRVALACGRVLLLWLVLLLISGPMLELPRESVEKDWVFVLADRSQSMTIGDAASGGAAARRTRDQQLHEIVDENAPLWRELASQRRVVWLGFHDGAFELQSAAKSQGDAEAQGSPVELGAAEGRRTSLGTALEQALQRGAARPVSGVVVLSDGRTDDPPSRALMRRLQAEGVKVFAVPLGSADPLGDLAIRTVEAPPRAFIRDKVPVVVELDRLGEGAADLNAVVRLIDADSGEELDSIDLSTAESRDRVTLTAKPSLSGEASWKVVLDTPQPDLIPDNNIKTVSIDLIDRPLKVLYVEGYPRWEYRYVKNLLIREKSISSSVMLLSADRDFAQEGNEPITRLPRSPEEWADYDVIILGDVPGTFFSPMQLSMLRDHVSQRGAGLLWIGGERAMPMSYVGTDLADLLPIRGSLELAPIGAAVNMKPTAAAERMGVLQIISGSSPSSSSGVGWPAELLDPSNGWSRLLWAQRLEPGRLKPTAQVLAESAQNFAGAPLPLVVHMRYGAGQTIYVATDEIWRWRYGRGELLPEQFWMQMIRLLGRESLGGVGVAAVLDADPRRLMVNQPMRIVLRLLDAQLIEQRRESIAALLQGADGRAVAELELRRVEGTEDQYAATYVPNETGAMRVMVVDPDLRRLNLEAPVEVYRPDDELRKAEADHELLASLAGETGGQVLQVSQVDALNELLPRRAVTTINPLTETIWDTPLAFVLVLLVVTLEWIGRKLIRLA